MYIRCAVCTGSTVKLWSHSASDDEMDTGHSGAVRALLHWSESTLWQCCYHAMTPKWVATPIRSDSIVFNQSIIASVITALCSNDTNAQCKWVLRVVRSVTLLHTQAISLAFVPRKPAFISGIYFCFENRLIGHFQSISRSCSLSVGVNKALRLSDVNTSSGIRG